LIGLPSAVNPLTSGISTPISVVGGRLLREYLAGSQRKA